ncbi:hypothetical protein CTI14_61380, partial [Methylobacterium radiotolerans]
MVQARAQSDALQHGLRGLPRRLARQFKRPHPGCQVVVGEQQVWLHHEARASDTRCCSPPD